MFLIVDNNDPDDAVKPALTTHDLSNIVFNYFYDTIGQNYEDALANALETENWAKGALEDDVFDIADLSIICCTSNKFDGGE